MSLLLYKYRSLQELDLVLDILLNERLYCCPYRKLNDPFEGQFKSFFGSLQIGSGGMLHAGANFETFADVAYVDGVRVASLSATKSDVRMWSHYADGHKCIAIEIDCTGLKVFEVKYRPNLLAYHKGIHTLGPTPQLILTGKSLHWEYEKEYRFIQDEEYVTIAGRIRRVLLGIHVDPEVEALLEKAAPNFEYQRMELDHDSLEVREPGRS